MRRLKTILQSRYLFKILCVICIIYSLLIAFYLPSNSKYNQNDTEVIGKIIQYEIDGNKLKLTLKGKEKLILYYYFKTEKEKINYEKKIELGLILKTKGDLVTPKKNTIPNGFNYREYLKYHHIHYYLIATNIEVLESNTSVLYYIKNKLIKRMDKIDATGYLRTFILGDKTLLDEKVMENYQQNGISHLFSISGMHVSLIVGMLMFVLDKVSYSNFYKYGIVIPILLFYLFLTGFGASILRTVIMFIVFSINKCFNLKIKRLDLMLLVLIIAILINPFILYDMGFQFSYSISFTLIVFYKQTAMLKKKWQKNLYTSFLCFLISFPICIYYFYQVNILSIFLNLIMIPLVSVVVFPMTLLTFIVPIIYPIYSIVIEVLETISTIFSNLKMFELVLTKPSLILILIYYCLIYLSLYNWRYLGIFVVVVLCHKYYLFLDNSFIFTMLDVGQGDSIFIKLPNNKGNILIDTGGEVNLTTEEWKKSKKEFSIVENNTISYLKSLGINRLDYLIITHGDYDHMGEAINLVNNFKVDNILFNNDEYNNLELELIEVLKENNIPYYQNIKELNIDGNKLYFLNNKLYDNDNSNVIYTELDNYKFLLMGDAGVEVEEDIIGKYNLIDIDVLKIGHHGSKTSTSGEFISSINPKYSIISVGKNNRYGHPNSDALDNLKDSTIYRTDIDGSVMFKIKNNKLEINTYAP